MKANKITKKKSKFKIKNKLVYSISIAIIMILVISTMVYSRSFNNIDLEIEGSKISNNEYIRAMNSKKYEVTNILSKNMKQKLLMIFGLKSFKENILIRF